MTWCPRCDVLTGGLESDECPSCGAGVIDVRPRAFQGGSRHVLELERPADKPLDASEVDLTSSDTPQPPSSTPRRLFLRKAFKFGVAASMLAGGIVYGLSRHEPSPKSAERPATTPTVSPPLGMPLHGSVLLAAQNGLHLINLSDGAATLIDPLGEFSTSYELSPDGDFVAHLNDTQLLTVTRLSSTNHFVVATDAAFFAWASAQDALLVSRHQVDPRGGERWRLESISRETREATLLLESRNAIASIFAKGPRTLFELYDDEGFPNVYELREPNSARLLRKRSALLDVSGDGTLAIVARRDAPGVYAIDLPAGRAKRIGSSKLAALSARISADGTRAAVVAGTYMPSDCEGGHECPQAFLTAGAPLWMVELKSMAMQRIYEPEQADLGRPSWGPADEWILLFEGDRPIGVNLGTCTPISISTTHSRFTALNVEYVP